MAKTRFSEPFELDRAKITTSPARFQGRQGEYSEDTVNAIVTAGYDKNLSPIVVWYDAALDKYVVISGHSRWEASRRLFEAGDKQLATMKVIEFLGDEDDAIDYAVLESNRDSSHEGLKSDIKAYKRAVAKGWNRNKLLTIFKPESKLRQLQDLSFLNPSGRFLQYLDTPEEKSFPYLARNAQWVGQLRSALPRLTDQHENELFDYLYTGSDKKVLTITKDKFINLVDRKVNTLDFDPDKPLNLKNIASANPFTDPVNEEIRALTSEMERLVKQQGDTRALIVRARKEGKEYLIPKFQQRIDDINAILLRKQEERDRLQKSIGKLERETVYDLFAAPPVEEQPAQPEPQPEPERVNAIYRGKLYKGVKVLEKIFEQGNFLRGDRYHYRLEGEGLDRTIEEKYITPFDPAKDKPGVENAYPLLDPDGSMYKISQYAWNGVSMSPERRGEDFMKDYEQALRDQYDAFHKIAEAHNTLDMLPAAWQRYLEKFREYARSYLHAQSNTLSSMITGPSGFPTRRAEKANERERRRYDDWMEWEKRAEKAIIKELKNEINPLSDRPSDVLKDLENKLQQLTNLQEHMKAVNAAHAQYLKDPASLDRTTFSPEVKEKIRSFKPAYSWEPHPYPPFQLTNNNASIKRVKERIAEVSAKVQASGAGAAGDLAFDGGRLVLNYDENRIQIFFDSKPDENIRTALKQNGYKWAPSQSAWQRILTDNALHAMRRESFKNALKITDEQIASLSVKKDEPQENNRLEQFKKSVSDFIADEPEKWYWSVVDQSKYGGESYLVESLYRNDKGNPYYRADRINKADIHLLRDDLQKAGYSNLIDWFKANFPAPASDIPLPEEDRKEITIKLNELAAAHGHQKYNLCDISVPGTNIYCNENKGIPRAEMPQFKGYAQPGSEADKLPKNIYGEVDGEALFMKMLSDKGIAVTEERIYADQLKATQSELDGDKVAGMVQKLKEDPTHTNITAPIFISSDNYVLDGHHRWAAITSYAIEKKEPVMMNVKRIAMPIEPLVKLSNEFADNLGIRKNKFEEPAPEKSKVRQALTNLVINPAIEKEKAAAAFIKTGWTEKEREKYGSLLDKTQPEPSTEKTKKHFTKEQREKKKKQAEKMIATTEKKLPALSEDKVLAIGRTFHEQYRSLYAQAIDESSDNKKRLTPTPENLIRWMKAPGKFDLIGVDTFKASDATADYKSIIAKQKVFNLFGIKV